MRLLIPIADKNKAEITDINSASSWALIQMDGGNIENISFVANYHDIINDIDTLVIKNEYEPIMDFLEREVMILVAHTQKTIEEIIEGYVFKELRDLG